MRKPVSWVVVADGHRARVLKNEVGRALQPALDHDFTAPNPLEHEVGNDRPGRSMDRAGSPSRHGLEQGPDHHRLRKEQFATEVAEVLDEAAAKNAFSRLFLIAPPQALGDLRAHLGGQARARIVGELALDLTHEPVRDIEQRLADMIHPG